MYTYLPADRAALHAAYWPNRAYWRELADQNAPHLTPRDLIYAARILHAVTIADQLLTVDGDERGRQSESDAGRSALELAFRDVLAPRHTLDPRDVACRAAAIALTNVNAFRDGDRGRDPRWTMPDAPDAFEGTRHQTTSKRSNSGRTVTTVTRSGVAPVIGRADRTAPIYVTVTRSYGNPVLGPNAWRCLAPSWKMSRRVVERGVTVPAVPAMPTMHAAVHLHLLEHAPRRGSGRNALAVMARTSALYGVGMVSDLTEHPEITPPLPGFDPRGVAVHRADMSGQIGVIALTATLNAHDTARQEWREELPAVRTLKSDRGRGLFTSADDEPRQHAPRPAVIERGNVCPAAFPTRERVTYLSRANCAADHRAAYVPPTWYVVAPDGTVTANTAPRVWCGHALVKRGALARPTSTATRGNVARRTIGTLTLEAFTVAAVETIAGDLTAGERVVIGTPDGTTARVNRGTDGRYSATITAADGTRVGPQFRTRTVEAIARRVVAAV